MNEHDGARSRGWTRDQQGKGKGGRRHPELERFERDSFILLQHVYTISGADPSAPINGARAGLQLGFEPERTERMIHYLSWVGYMKHSAAGPHLSLAPEGIDYLERQAGRRHSVRAPADQEIPLRVYLG